jgi:hypothetical protein
LFSRIAKAGMLQSALQLLQSSLQLLPGNSQLSQHILQGCDHLIMVAVQLLTTTS